MLGSFGGASKHYKERVARNLQALHNLTLEEFCKFTNCGGASDFQLHYFRLCVGYVRLPPPSKSNCICGHRITDVRFVSNADHTQFVVVGNCCIHRFLSEPYRTCGKCGARHKNRKDNLCNACRERMKKEERLEKLPKCEDCGAPHMNRVVNRCKECRQGKCDKCGRPCGSAYKTCYACSRA